MACANFFESVFEVVFSQFDNRHGKANGIMRRELRRRDINAEGVTRWTDAGREFKCRGAGATAKVEDVLAEWELQVH